MRPAGRQAGRQAGTHAGSASSWRHLPAGIGAWLVLVAGVNALMVFYAIHTFPGAAGGNAFDISNHYDSVLRRAEAEARLGWQALVRLQDGRPVVSVTTQDGVPVVAEKIEGFARRPVGPEQTMRLSFFSVQNRFFAEQPLAGQGNWDVALTITQGAHALHLTRRVVVR